MSEQARPPVEVVIDACVEGYTVHIALTVPAEKIAEACRRLAALGISPAPAPSSPANGNGKTKAPRSTPVYDNDGRECCPTHNVELREGRYGMYCPSKASAGQPANDKGYCALKFD